MQYGLTNGLVVSIEDFYQNRPVRIYEEEAPTLRSDRHGLKVGIQCREVRQEEEESG